MEFDGFFAKQILQVFADLFVPGSVSAAKLFEGFGQVAGNFRTPHHEAMHFFSGYDG